MSRATLLAGLAILLAAPLAQAAPWLQPRGDAAATGFQPDEGPEWPDVALRIELPDPFTQSLAQPLILEDRVLMLVSPHKAPLRYTGPWRVVSIDLDTGGVSTVAELSPDEGPSHRGIWPSGARGSIATDGRTLYIGGNHSVHAVPLDPGGHEWSREVGAVDEDDPMEPCGRLRLQRNHLTVLCTETDPDAYGLPGKDSATLVARLDATTGEDLWTWTHPRPAASGPQAPTVPSPDNPRPRYVHNSFPFGLAVSEPLVVAQTFEGQVKEQAASGRSGVEFRLGVHALAANTGDPVWTWTGAPSEFTTTMVNQTTGALEVPRQLMGNPTISDQAVYVRANSVHKLAFGTGDIQWSQPIGEEDFSQDPTPFPALALSGGQLYAMSGQTLYQMDTETRAGWSTTLNQSAGKAFVWDPIVTPSAVYATTCCGPGGGPDSLHAFDVDSGEILWTKPVHAFAAFSVGEGLVVLGEHIEREGSSHPSDDYIVVLGRTSASPVPSAQPSTIYPAAGESIDVDLAGSEAGLQGPVTKYKAIWGDGTNTEWQGSPVLSHAYDEPGDVTARFIVGNDANQTNSTTMTFQVGATPPAEPNFIETAFARDNQDMTFGILGILLAIGGTIVGVVARRRHEAHEADRLQAYERVLATEIAEGRVDDDLTGRMAPMRAALGISEKEHARLVETLLARRAGTSVALVPGETFLARYEVIARLGAGGGGTTYLCHDQRIDRQVVIKALHATEQDTAATVREARAFGAVSHENVVALHDVEQVGDRVFLVLEHVPGGSLDVTNETPGLDRLAEDLLSGLAAVHDAAIVHRDVKPSNILLTAEGGHKLADFGIAHTPGFQTSVGGLGGGAVGTVQYMSPEQAKGRKVDHRSDLYSSAVVLWEAFTGETYMAPEPGETATELQMRIAQADRLPRVPEGAGEEIATWFATALDPDPGERFQTAEEMLEALQAADRNTGR